MTALLKRMLVRTRPVGGTGAGRPTGTGPGAGPVAGPRAAPDAGTGGAGEPVVSGESGERLASWSEVQVLRSAHPRRIRTAGDF